MAYNKQFDKALDAESAALGTAIDAILKAINGAQLLNTDVTKNIM